jgi:hypothetical protein
LGLSGSAIRAIGPGQIIGNGIRNPETAGQSVNVFAYLLTPVPEPSTCLLAAEALGLCIARQRRRTHKICRNTSRATRAGQQFSMALALG